MKPHSAYCRAGCSPAPTQEELTRNHGTPAEFREAVMLAMMDGVTADEAYRATVDYEREWCSAPTVMGKPT